VLIGGQIMKAIKKFVVDLGITYVIVVALSLIVATYLKHYYNRELPFIATTERLLYIAILITGAITLIRIEKINVIIRLILSYAMVLPTGFIAKETFGVTIFKTPLILIYALVIITIIYGISLFIAKTNLSKEAQELNKLIRK
jgi:hypothetical protein